jgi:predicted Fe-Mo cluster-binding NifX family protein
MFMKIAFPVKEDNGLDSILDEHFGVAKLFLIVETGTMTYTVKANQKLKEGGTKCKTTVLGKKANVDAVVTNCIGDGSQRNLASKNVKVYQARKQTIKENLALMENDGLKLFHMFDLCQNKKNKKEGDCGHQH